VSELRVDAAAPDASPPDPAPPPGWRAHIGGSRAYPVVLFLGVAVLLYLLMSVALTKFAGNYAFHDEEVHRVAAEPFYTGPRWLAGWVRFDAGWYRNIADNGYFFAGKTAQSSVAFFPLYPLLTRWLQHAFGGDTSMWGIPITFASGFGAALLYWHWLRRRFDLATARVAFALFAVWPYALYLYGAVYADALFVFLVLAAFVAIDHDRVALAALLGALATATRPVGVAVVLGLTARVLEQRGAVLLPVLDRIRGLSSRGSADPPFGEAPAGDGAGSTGAGRPRPIVVRLRRLRALDPTILLSATGLVTYMVYLSQKFGDPFAFATAEAAPGWDQDPGPKVWFKTAWFSRLVHLPDSGLRYFAVVTLQGLLVLAMVLLLPRIVRRLGWAYGGYTLVLLAFPLLGSKDFQGLGRYALGAFPAFAMAGELLVGRPRLRRAWFTFSVLALCFFASSFGRGGYVA
jgi:hypothetical protein